MDHGLAGNSDNILPQVRPRGRGALIDLVSNGRGPAVLLVLFADWLIAADALVTATIMPSVGRDLDAFAWFGWATSTFLVGTVVASAMSGWIAGRLGIAWSMALASAALGIGCVASASAATIGVFLGGRIVQGLAAGLLNGICYVIFATLLDRRHLPLAFALVTSVWGGATLLGPLIGGLFADAGNWRGAFWFFAAQSALVVIVSPLVLPRAAGRTVNGGRLPIVQLSLLVAGIGTLATAGLRQNIPEAFALGLLGLVLLVAAWRLERTRRDGFLPHSSERWRLDPAYLAYLATSAAGVSFALYGPALLIAASSVSATQAGYIVALEALTWTLASLSTSTVSDRRRPFLIRTGSAMIAAGVLGQAAAFATGGVIFVAVAGAVMGAGFGMSYASMSQHVIGHLDDDDKARGSSAIAAFRGIGAAVGAAFTGMAANAAGFGADMSGERVATVAVTVFGIALLFAVKGRFAVGRLSRSGAFTW